MSLTAASLPAQSEPASWTRAIGRRLAALWFAKMIGSMLGISGFFWLYFWLLQHPTQPPFVMPLTAIDRWVPVSGAAVWPYGSLWFYVVVGPAVTRDWTELGAYLRGTLAMSVLGLGFFWLWPTTLPPMAVDWSQYPALGFLKSVDASGNAFPSMHVAFAVFTGVTLARALRAVAAPWMLRALNLCWAIAIIWSTLATRQHVALDVLGGAVLGALCGVVAHGWPRSSGSAN